MIRVVKVNKMRIPAERAGVVYVGRAFAGWPGHPLANPYTIRQAYSLVDPKSVKDIVEMEVKAREKCLSAYSSWLLSRLTLDDDLALLWESTNHGAKPLGCWCTNATAGDGSPVVCHAQILAELLRERLAPT